MRKPRPLLYVLLPVLYVGILFGLVVLQFSKNEAFAQSLGDLTVTGKAPASGQSEQVLDLQIRGRGLDFFFSAAKPVVIETEDGVSHNARPVSWTLQDNTIQVVFQFQFKLLFQKAGKDGRGLVIQPVIPDSLSKVSSITIPFGPEGDAQFKRDPHLPVLEIRKGNVLLVATLDGGQDRIGEDNTFRLNVRGGASKTVHVDQAPSDVDAVSFWLVHGGKPRTAAELDAALKDFWNKAYTAWTVDRYRSDSGAWDMGDGTVKYSETLLAAYLREALNRGDYPAAYEKVTPGIANYPSSWGIEAMPYLGNVMETTQAKRRQLEVLASKDQTSWSGRFRLWLDAKYYGPEGFAGRLQKALLSGDVPDLLPDRLAFLNNLLAMKDEKVSADNLDSRIESVLQQALSGILRQGDDLYLLTKEGWLDLRSTVLLGRILLKYANLYQISTYQSVGIQLILSALGKQDKLAQIPEILVMDGAKVSRQEGTILPEELYPLLASSRLTETPLTGSWDPGAFIRTPAVLVSQSITPAAAKFVLQFPTGFAEHFVIQGVPPFDHILLHGIRWRSDVQFQSYSDGWYYNASTQTLYFKIKHRQDREELVISYQPES